ncbi:hypothetical protein [Actinoplanes sp. L3-i22]|uniref:hypothetical protein n=1 Tax=Actinoplanes sp. L3-i22 TaxID=2836373 RepID=UPI001C78F1DC|nr:hypothetical protein [Actinoplanes sp. L3-i22]BCY10898.1 hypothetical protein L3i22_059860 [Actinoplanes sp. L3-i22]
MTDGTEVRRLREHQQSTARELVAEAGAKHHDLTRLQSGACGHIATPCPVIAGTAHADLDGSKLWTFSRCNAQAAT